MVKALRLTLILTLALLICFATLQPLSHAQTNGQRSGNITFVTALPGTCKPAAGIIYAVIGMPTTYHLCTATNTFTRIDNTVVSSTVPVIVELLPVAVTAGGTGFTLIINGINFASGASVKFNGVAKTTTVVSATQVTATINSADIAVAGAANVTVTVAGVTSATATMVIHPASGASISPSIFNVRAAPYNAVCDGTTNDVGAFRAAILAINNNGGGTLYVPGGTCRIQVGDPASDTNISTLTDTRKAVLALTANNVKIQLDKNATVRVVTSHIYQNTTGPGPANYTALLGFNGVSALDQVEITGGRWTWETTGGAALTGTLNSENGWQFLRGATKSLNIHDTVIDGFPQGGTNVGYTSGGFSLQDMRIDNIRVTSYGGGGHDGFWYLQGRTTMTRSYFKPSRSFYSHAFYTGADRPGTLVANNVFEGFQQSADNKYPIQIYSEGGGEIIDITVKDNEFRDCNVWFIAQKNDGVTAVRNLKVVGNFGNGNFGSGGFYYAVEATRCNECLFQGNRFYNYAQGLRLEFAKHTRVADNTLNGCQIGVLTTAGENNLVTNNNIQGVTAASGYGIYFSGSKITVANNIVAIGSNRTGIYGLGGSGFGDYIVNGNTVTGDGVAFGVTTGAISSLDLLNNNFNMTTGQPVVFPFTASVTEGKIAGNTIKTGSTLDPGAFLIDSNTGTYWIQNNEFSTGNLYWNATVVIPEGNKILTGQFANTTGVVRARNNTISGRVDTNVANSGTSYTPNVGLYPAHIVTLTGNATIANPTGPSNGDVISFTFIQDATGGRSITWGAAYKASCSFTTTANTKSGIAFRYDGTHWVQTDACVTGL